MSRPALDVLLPRLDAHRLVGQAAIELEAHGCGACSDRILADWCKPCLLALWIALDDQVAQAADSARQPRPSLRESAPSSAAAEISGGELGAALRRCGHCPLTTASSRTCPDCKRPLCPPCAGSLKRICPERGGRVGAVAS